MITRILLGVLLLFAGAGMAGAADALYFRLYLTDGTSLVTYGEFARVGDRVIFSMRVGGSADQPRLQAVTLPAVQVDWTRTDRHVASTRFQNYARTRGEEDFLRLSNEVADVLNDVLLTPDRTRALQIAERARVTLAAWPRDHFGYRQNDVQEIVALLDEAISDLRAAAGIASFELALVASVPDIPLEAVAVAPSLQEQVVQAFRVSGMVDRASDRVSLLQGVLGLLVDASSVIPADDLAVWRRTAESQIREELNVDARYAQLTRRLMSRATELAARARVADIERVLNDIPREDDRLGGRRPEVVEALRASVQERLDAARELRLLRDRWTIRRSLYQQYQRSVGTYLVQLVRSQAALESIRRLEGPDPDTLVTLGRRLNGGVARLERMRPPADMRTAHDMLIGAWRFADNAVSSRYRAVEGADVSTAWEASSSAAGALLLLSRVQQEIRVLLEPPRVR